jgi:hypothetical protein
MQVTLLSQIFVKYLILIKYTFTHLTKGICLNSPAYEYKLSRSSDTQALFLCKQ